MLWEHGRSKAVEKHYQSGWMGNCPSKLSSRLGPNFSLNPKPEPWGTLPCSNFILSFSPYGPIGIQHISARSSTHSRSSITPEQKKGSKIRPAVLVRAAALDLQEEPVRGGGRMGVGEVRRLGGQAIRAPHLDGLSSQPPLCRSRIPSPQHRQVCD